MATRPTVEELVCRLPRVMAAEELVDRGDGCNGRSAVAAPGQRLPNDCRFRRTMKRSRRKVPHCLTCPSLMVQNHGDDFWPRRSQPELSMNFAFCWDFGRDVLRLI